MSIDDPLIALIHKDSDSCYGVSFPNLPGVTTAGDTIDEAMQRASEVLGFAAEDWDELTGGAFPPPRTIDELRLDPAFSTAFSDGVVAAVPLPSGLGAAA